MGGFLRFVIPNQIVWYWLLGIEVLESDVSVKMMLKLTHCERKISQNADSKKCKFKVIQWNTPFNLQRHFFIFFSVAVVSFPVNTTTFCLEQSHARGIPKN